MRQPHWKSYKNVETVEFFHLLHIRTDKVQAIENIQAVFDRFRGRGYSSKTTTVRNLCRVLLHESNLQENLKLLDLEELIEYIRNKNDSFEETFLDRERGKGKTKNFQEVKMTLISIYKTFVKTLEAKAFLEQSSDYNFLMEEINNLVLKFNKEAKPMVKKTEQVMSPIKSKCS